ncbi:MAG TPA: phosphoribosylformylglycinamidine cyclo-ligase [Candidatus Pelagibacter bacterium]|jgi:phosphoribosylaminoimidazole synthetase|nr:phosphoribosylformylglycinamidine cyclo-ligase [Candidatus Pelagibacter bacterium]|tara:strand:- start:19809 stop:20837 length:1029 start_codon:yes stop_codon:yes gene_type:complete
MNKHKFTYEKSGVNIAASDKFVKFISKISKKNKKNKSFENIGGFGSISSIPKNIKKPKIVASTDGVGTKIEIANLLKKYDTIGIDLVAMCVNDLIVQGAKPLLFLDYISINKINLAKLKSIVKGIIKGCNISGCELVGGETAEMPGTYESGKFDIAGFSIGIVDQNKILQKKKIKKNNLILAIPSSGIHSNGYSLVRHILKKKNINIKKNKFLNKELLKPTKIYVKEILSLIKYNLIIGCANITGGGLSDNIKRIIPEGLTAEINLNNIKTKKIFKWLRKNKISDKEMLKTFNCGVGFCIIIQSKNLKKIKKFFSREYEPYIIGKIISGKNKIKLNEKINWS